MCLLVHVSLFMLSLFWFSTLEKLDNMRVSFVICRRSEGLQTARVLAPIPKHAMLWAKGFPTKVQELKAS